MLYTKWPESSMVRPLQVGIYCSSVQDFQDHVNTISDETELLTHYNSEWLTGSKVFLTEVITTSCTSTLLTSTLDWLICLTVGLLWFVPDNRVVQKLYISEKTSILSLLKVVGAPMTHLRAPSGKSQLVSGEQKAWCNLHNFMVSQQRAWAHDSDTGRVLDVLCLGPLHTWLWFLRAVLFLTV